MTINTPKLDIVKSDPGDNKVIECAVSLEARFIVSGDKELLEAQHYVDVRILAPREFLSIGDP